MEETERIPILVKQFNSTKEKVTKCDHFEIFTGQNDQSKNKGVSNVFTIKEYNEDKDVWFVSYSTGKMDSDDPGKQMKNAKILHNSENHIVFGLETEDGCIHIYKFESGDDKPGLIVKF